VVLKANTDCTVKYANAKMINKNTESLAVVGSGAITVTGKGNFKGSVTVNYNVVRQTLENEGITILVDDFALPKNAKKGYLAKAKLTTYASDVNGTVLKLGTKDSKGIYGNDFYVEFQNEEDLTGTPAVDSDIAYVVKASTSPTSYYVGAKAESSFKIVDNTWSISPKNEDGSDAQQVTSWSIANKNVKDWIDTKGKAKMASVTFNGTAVTFTEEQLNGQEAYEDVMLNRAVSVYLNQKYGKLTAGEDYVVVGYLNNGKQGTATMLIRGQGMFSGIRKVNFKIVKAAKKN
jgi:hypothetical protein